MSDIGYLTVLIHLSGDGFQPKTIINKYGYKVNIIRSPGDTIKHGVHIGDVSKEGFCYIEFDSSLKYENIIPEAVKTYKAIEEDIKRNNLNITSMDISLLFSGCQGNMELSSNELKLLYSIGCTISITYIGATDIDYQKQRRLNRIVRKYSTAII